RGGVITCVLLAACGCNGNTMPATPSPPPPPTASSLTIIGVDALRTGFFADYTVSASMSDGTTQIVTTQAALTTSDPSIATVNGNGRVTALSQGTISLSASYQGRITSRNVNVVFNYGGTWIGTYAVRTCDQTGVFAAAHYCQNLGLEPLPLS